MGTIIIHAGMAKAGSSAVQGFLHRQRAELEVQGIVLARAVVADRTVAVEPHHDGPVNSGDVVPLLRDAEVGEHAAKAFAHGLGKLADRSRQVVLTGEAFEQSFWRPDRSTTRALAQLGERHRVRVAYYVRPQHTALEAAWRQWGFRSGRSPADYIRTRATIGDRYHYLRTLQRTREEVPDIEFVVRPFRRDLLHGGDVVRDFVHVFLPGTVVPQSVPYEDNIGLALDLVNVLQPPAGARLWSSPHDNWVFNRVKQILQDIDAPTSEAARAGRQLLQHWCHERFEDENLDLVRAEGWLADDWVPSPRPGGDEHRDIGQLDALWAPPTMPQVVDALVHVLYEHIHSGSSRAAAQRSHRRDLDADAEARLRTLREDHRRLEATHDRLRTEHERLIQRRSVRAALHLARLAAPVLGRLRRPGR